MTGKEAKKISDKLSEIYNYLIDDDKIGFYKLGRLVESLEQIVAIDKVSFNPTIEEE